MASISARFSLNAFTHSSIVAGGCELPGLRLRRSTWPTANRSRSCASVNWSSRPARNARPSSPIPRIAEGAGARFREVPDAFLFVAPHGRRRPLLEVHARRGVAVEVVRVSERQPDVVDDQKRLRTQSVVVEAARQALEPLLLGLVIGVLDEHGEQLQRVALCAGRAALCVIDEIEVGPAPAIRAAMHFVPGWLRSIVAMSNVWELCVHPRLFHGSSEQP